MNAGKRAVVVEKGAGRVGEDRLARRDVAGGMDGGMDDRCVGVIDGVGCCLSGSTCWLIRG
jgi:hypothetical protein